MIFLKQMHISKKVNFYKKVNRISKILVQTTLRNLQTLMNNQKYKIQEINLIIFIRMHQIHNYNFIHKKVLKNFSNLSIFFLVILIKLHIINKLKIFDRNHFQLMI